MNNNLFSTTFDNYHKRRRVVKEELKKVNNEITKVTGRVTLMKYRIQKFMLDYQQTVHRKSEVDKLLSFHLSTSLNHPKMDFDGYTFELERISKAYYHIRDKHLDKIPRQQISDVNVYFPEINRRKIDHLAEIRKEAKHTINDNQLAQRHKELEIFETYQQKKNKLDWTLKQLNNDPKINAKEKRKKKILINNTLKELDNEINEIFTNLSKAFPNLVSQTQLINDMSSGDLRRMPIKLDDDPEDKPEIRVIKRKIILLNIRRQRCEAKIKKMSKEMEKNSAVIDAKKLYESAKQAGEFNHSVNRKRIYIKKMKQDLKDYEVYMKNLLKSRDILVEEINLLENMESLTHNDIIYELIKQKPKITGKDEDESYMNYIPNECIVDDKITDISGLGDNIDIENINLNEITNAINDEMVNIMNQPEPDYMLDSHRKLLENNLDNHLDDMMDEETLDEFNRLKMSETNMSMTAPSIFLEIEKNIETEDLPDTTQSQLHELNTKLNLLTNEEYIPNNISQEQLFMEFEDHLNKIKKEHEDNIRLHEMETQKTKTNIDNDIRHKLDSDIVMSDIDNLLQFDNE